MDPNDILQRVAEARREGRLADALTDLVWLHEHALEDMPSWHGVRLTVALGIWLEIAAEYPPARTRLLKIRDRDTERLLAGNGNHDLLVDVIAINAGLGLHANTCTLVKALDALAPELVLSCAFHARQSLVACNEYALARKYLDVGKALERRAQVFNKDLAEIAQEAPSRAPKFEAFVCAYADYFRLIIQVLLGVGEDALADEVRMQSLDLVNSPRARAAVAAIMHLPPTEAWSALEKHLNPS